MQYLALKTMIWIGVGICAGSFLVGVLFGGWLTLVRWRVQDGRDKRLMRELEKRVKGKHAAVWRPRYMRQLWK